ncbi:S24 family peptidase [Aeromonas hydrophila]|uniref:S24 family peptidase n=1 Tax=Aeromonas hydrophila TaxID=644 RepID=UPI001111AD91|nr:S24 family peptidase [Aeromonas hydrophila]
MENLDNLPTLSSVTPEMVDIKTRQLGHLLTNARKHRYRSALDASKELGVGQSTYLAYEKGGRQQVLAWWLCTIQHVFAPRYGVDPSYLLGLSEEQERTEAPLWLLNVMAPHLKNGDETIQLLISDDAMAPNLQTGDIAIFEKVSEVSKGGIYAIEYPNCQVYARWIMPSAVDGWQIRDSNGVQETLGEEAILKLKVRGKYLFRLTK